MKYYWKIKKLSNLYVIYPISKKPVAPIAKYYFFEVAVEICDAHNKMVFELTGDCSQALEIEDRVFVDNHVLSGYGIVKYINKKREILNVKLDASYNTNMFRYCQIHGFKKTYNKK